MKCISAVFVIADTVLGKSFEERIICVKATVREYSNTKG